MKKTIFTIILALVIALGSVTAWASQTTEKGINEQSKTVTVTSKNELVSIRLPSNEWTEVESDEYDVAFADGESAIAVDVYERGDDIPELVVPEDTSIRIYRIINITEKYMFITNVCICGDDNDSAIITCANNIKIDESKITDEMLGKSEIVIDDYSLREESYDAWVTTSALNIRSDSTTEAAILGILSYGEKVNVTGTILKNGVEIGWVRINYNGVNGYISSEFISNTEVEPQKPQKTGNTMTLYFLTSNAVTVYEYTDGTWYDEDGLQYWATVDRQWVNEEGVTVYTYIPDVTAAQRTGYACTIFYANGNGITIYEYDDGTYWDNDGIKYWATSGGEWASSQGDTLYSTEPSLGPDSVQVRIEGGNATLTRIGMGIYQDIEGETYEAYDDYSRFVRQSDGLEVYVPEF